MLHGTLELPCLSECLDLINLAAGHYFIFKLRCLHTETLRELSFAILA